MIEYIINNKEWLFSGMGVFLLGLIGAIFRNRHQQGTVSNQSKVTSPSKPNGAHIQTQTRELAETEAGKIAKRFGRILELMNEGRNSCQFTISQLAQIMGLDKVSELEDVILGKEEPGFQFISNFCEIFGVNERWLAEGKEHPFSNNEQTKGDPLWYFEDIETINPKGIYFVRAKTDTAQAFILLKISDWKFKILHRIWHISDHVGAGGQRQLLSFYKLIKKLRDEKGYCARCGGLTLGKEEFDALYRGDRFPGKYINFGRTEDPWWDDLTDINHQYPIAANYEQSYGKSFIKAQEIIRWMLEEDKRN